MSSKTRTSLSKIMLPGGRLFWHDSQAVWNRLLRVAVFGAVRRLEQLCRALALSGPRLRGVVTNRLVEVHRHHLATRMRAAKRELPLDVEDTSNRCLTMAHQTS
jgi:hypothetical protein